MLNRGTIRHVRSLIIFGLDLILVVAIFSGVYFLRMARLPDYLSADLWLIVSTMIATLFLSGTYFKERSFSLPSLPVRTFFICLAGGCLCVVWVYLLGPTEFNSYFGRGVLPFGTILFGAAATLNRYAINSVYHMQERGIELLYLGYSDSCAAFLQELKNHVEVRAITIVDEQMHQLDAPQVRQISCSLDQSILKNEWQAIIIDPEHETSDSEKALLINARLSGIPVLSLADYYESNWYMVPVNHIGDDWFLRSQGFSMLGSPVSNRLKRITDLVMAVVMLVLTSPVLILCAASIKLTSKGPILFQQIRVGFQGKPFSIYKFRTMHVDAEPNGAQWAAKNDPRVTLIGNFLRKSRLDELPQCWNVLNGSMSFIGPRPERPEFTAELNKQIPYYDLRHTVKPGISGWAQVIFPYGASTEDALKKLQYELYYIKHQSLLLDLNIMVRTAITVFQRAGR